MKLFASILASVFLLQASTPVWCATGCEDEVLKHLRTTVFEVCEIPGNCCMMESEQVCEEKISACEEQSSEKPCTGSNDCCTPCCAVPLFTCYCQDSDIFNFTSQPVSITGQLPSSNGIPHAGFRADCFQPPESMS